METKRCCGPGYASPQDAMKGPREKVMFVLCPHTEPSSHDMMCTIDVDPDSETYCQVLSRLDFPNYGDEVHHCGWNTCSSCYNDPSAKRSHLVLPCLNSDRIYIVNVQDPRKLDLEVTIEPELLHDYNVSMPHTAHCTAAGDVIISTLGDANGNNKGNFFLLDGTTFKPRGTYLDNENTVPFNYDFWYQPRIDLLVSTGWGGPNTVKKGFHATDVMKGNYGFSVYLFRWSTHEKIQSIDLPELGGSMPFEIRFKHDPNSPYAFFGSVLGSCLWLLKPESEGSEQYTAQCAVKIPSIEVEGWLMPEMPPMLADIVISMDDHYLYASNFLHGDVRQYDISDPEDVRLTGQIFVAGCLHKETGVKIVKGDGMKEQPPARYVKGKRIEGGPNMLQLSLDGKRLYVTTSLYRIWDEQFHPRQMKAGASMLQIDISENGGMTLNENFLVDFGALEGGPYLAHEMRYPGGDCTSDIWL